MQIDFVLGWARADSLWMVLIWCTDFNSAGITGVCGDGLIGLTSGGAVGDTTWTRYKEDINETQVPAIPSFKGFACFSMWISKCVILRLTFIERVNVYVWTHNHLDSTQRRALSGAIQFPVRVSAIWSPGPPGLADITWWTPGLLVTSPDDLGPDFSWSGSVCAAVCYNSRPTVQAHYVRPDPGRPWRGKVLQVSLFSLGRCEHPKPDPIPGTAGYRARGQPSWPEYRLFWC